MTRSIRDRIKLSEEFRTNSKLPWVPLEFAPIDKGLSNLTLQVTPDKEYVPFTVLRHAFVLAEYLAACDLAGLKPDLYLPWSGKKAFIFHHFKYVRIQPGVCDKLTVQLYQERSKARPSKLALTELHYHIIVPTLACMLLPERLDKLPIERLTK